MAAWYRLPCRPFLCLSVLLLLACVPTWGKTFHTEKATIRFLADSTSFRNSWGTNQDIYLAEMEGRHSSTPLLAKLVDVYPYSEFALPRAVLTSSAGSRMRVQRDPECDVAYQDLRLLGAPGDLRSILPETMEFAPALKPMPPAKTTFRAIGSCAGLPDLSVLSASICHFDQDF